MRVSASLASCDVTPYRGVEWTFPIWRRQMIAPASTPAADERLAAAGLSRDQR